MWLVAESGGGGDSMPVSGRAKKWRGCVPSHHNFESGCLPIGGWAEWVRRSVQAKPPILSLRLVVGEFYKRGINKVRLGNSGFTLMFA